MEQILGMNTLDLATIAAVIAALVSVVSNALKINKQYRSLLAIVFSVAFLLLPPVWLEKIVTALIVGLTASGVYSNVKPTNEELNKRKNNND